MRTHATAVALFALLAVSLLAFAQAQADTASFTCGAPVEHEGAVLHAMPYGGLWGFVDASGEWVIAPAYERVTDFSEGLAVVAEVDSHWGVIDEAGNWVHEPTFAAQTYSDYLGRRVHTPPLEPYSEGCSAGVGPTRSDPPFFIDRSGTIHWADNPPAALADEHILRFGSFSEGKAWFNVFDMDSDGDHGWVDAKGEIVLPAAYRWTGDFVGGLAPAETPDYKAAFINADGEPVIPRKWTWYAAESFSEGIALVKPSAFDVAYLRSDGDWAFQEIVDPSTGASSEIVSGGAFSEGLVAVVMESDDGSELVYADVNGNVVFKPVESVGAHACSRHAISSLGDFRNGLARLMTVTDPNACDDLPTWAELADYEVVEYVYVDSAGEVVLRQSEVAAPPATD